jgi:spermidine/putrescine ABC transporter ATP-binding subunit
MDYLELKRVSKKFGKVVAVDNVSLGIKKGEFLTLLGPSGCGKTTVLRIIAGLTKVDEGGVYLNGEDITNIPPHKRGIGMFFQNYALWPHMNVYKNVAFGLEIRKMKKDEIKDRVKKVLELVGLSGFEERYPKELSGGEQQRVALARALIIQPSVLLLDEPLSNLDRKLRDRMRTELRLLHERLGITTVFVTHDQEEALTMSDRLAVMNQGKVIQVGTPIEIYEKPETAFVADFIGDSNFFKGKVLSISDSWVIIEIDGGLQLYTCPRARNYFNSLKEGNYVTLCVRPEDIEILTEKPEFPQNTFTGKVEYVTYLGSKLRYHVRLDINQRLIIDTTDVVGTRGDKVYVRLKPECCLPIPKKEIS